MGCSSWPWVDPLLACCYRQTELRTSARLCRRTPASPGLHSSGVDRAGLKGCMAGVLVDGGCDLFPPSISSAGCFLPPAQWSPQLRMGAKAWQGDRTEVSRWWPSSSAASAISSAGGIARSSAATTNQDGLFLQAATDTGAERAATAAVGACVASSTCRSA